MVPAIHPGHSSTLPSNTSTKSGKIKSISLSGQVTMLGVPPHAKCPMLMDRHDNDHHFPRSPAHIFGYNRIIRDKFYDVFKPNNSIYPLSIPIIPSYGNNDVWPYIPH